MQGIEEKCHKLAQFSQKACKIATKLDEDLTDRLSLMDLNFSFDGLGKLYNDLGRACETSKLAKISSKCVDLAKKFAEDVSTDWLGMDIGPIDEESVGSTCENIEPQIKLNENEEGLDDSAISAVSNYNSESTNANNASDQESEIKTPLDNSVIGLEAALQDKATDDMLCSQVSEDVIHGDLDALSEVSKSNDDSPSVVSNDKTDEITAQNVGLFTIPDIFAHWPSDKLDDFTDEAFASFLSEIEHWNLDALPEVRKSHDGNSSVVPCDKKDEIRPEAFESLSLSKEINDCLEVMEEALLHDRTSNMSSSKVDDVPIKAHVDPNALAEVSKSHDVTSSVGPGDKTDETTAEADNLVNFSKPLEFGGFEDVDLKDDWEDDVDYDLDLVSYYESIKKSSKKKMAAKFISRWRSLKSCPGEVAHKSDANSADSDWEIL
ncbi:hypothetical protein FCM35_KLT05647 [Carex littledalei]|uniref:Uncharacterized protein n=1 Tax=Carex littledalei TaxID=544730 RepID=A0A833QSP2_9POAL|nr:hypothetical protein FCM35_KLT05647 [Carex littledalei]